MRRKVPTELVSADSWVVGSIADLEKLEDHFHGAGNRDSDCSCECIETTGSTFGEQRGLRQRPSL